MMFSRVWGWIAAVLAVLVARLSYQRASRKEAEAKAEGYKKEARISEMTNEIHRGVNAATAEARTKANEVKSSAESRPDSQRPTGSFRR